LVISMTLVLDPEQNFTCKGCGQCCRRSFDPVVPRIGFGRARNTDSGL
jgi:uncharacterized cysteine cluster protein YcgN (CxxCxxCC family)